MTRTTSIGLKAAWTNMLANPGVGQYARQSGLLARKQRPVCARRSDAWGILAGCVLGCMALLSIPGASWAASVSEYLSASPADGARQAFNIRHELTDPTGFGLKMDASLPAPGKYADLALTPRGFEPVAGNASQPWLAAVALLLAAGASLAWRWRRQGAATQNCRQSVMDAPAHEESGQVRQLRVQSENASVDFAAQTMSPAAVLATAEVIQAATVSVAARPALTIVERAMKRNQAQGAGSQT